MRRVAALAMAMALLAACGDDGDSASDSPEPDARASTTAEPSTTSTTGEETTTTEAPTLGSVRVALTEVASLDAPVALALRSGFDPWYVAEREGRVRVVRDGEVDPEPLVDVSDETSTDGELGLLGLAFSPNGQRLYISYTDENDDSRVDELTMGAGDAEVDLASRRNVLLVDQPPFRNHKGGNIAFGPDGFLYLGLGDGGSGGDPDGRAQDTEELLGKILRIDPQASGGDPYAIPADNPFAGGGGRGEIFVYGVRNPWRFSFDRETGDLWIGDVGQNEVEEIDLLPAGSAAGANLGWDRLEGTRPFEGEAPDGAVPPVFEYGRDDGFSVTGGYVYRGAAIPGLRGAYVYGDYGVSELRALAVEGGEVTGERTLDVSVEQSSLVSFAEDADGELLVLSINGPIYRLEPAA